MDYLSAVEGSLMSESEHSIALKRPHSLKLEGEDPVLKKQRFQHQAQVLLQSPDLNFLKLNSPELEKMLIAQSGMVTTPTPSQISALTKAGTEEQDNFAKGFLEALNNLHQQNQPVVSTSTHPVAVAVNVSVPTSDYIDLQTVTSLPQATPVAVTLGLPSTSVQSSALPTSGFGQSVHQDLHVKVKQEEPQTVPQMSTSPQFQVSGAVAVDLQDQERLKLERKRARNRDAARRCRNRKLDHISHLEHRVRELKAENCELSSNANGLREEVCKLKEQIVQHIRSGCQIMVGPNMKL